MTSKLLAKKSLGQHWLADPTSLEAMCSAANVQAGDTILEIGPGTGELTQRLLRHGATVVAVELDERLATQLTKRFTGLPFTLNLLSIMDFDLTSLPAPYKVVANIPYYLSNHLFRMLSETQQKPEIAVLLVQKEVAQRVTAKPGDMSLLSVSIQCYWHATSGDVVPAKLFTPPPKVDSQILILKRLAKPLMNDSEAKSFFWLVKAGFSARRKKLRSSLSGGLRISKPEAEQLLVGAGIDPNRRAQELSLDDWHRLYLQLQA